MAQGVADGRVSGPLDRILWVAKPLHPGDRSWCRSIFFLGPPGLDPPPEVGGGVVKKGPVWWQTPAPDIVHGDMLQRRMTVRREWWTEGADVTLCVSLCGDIILMRTRSNIFQS